MPRALASSADGGRAVTSSMICFTSMPTGAELVDGAARPGSDQGDGWMYWSRGWRYRRLARAVSGHDAGLGVAALDAVPHCVVPHLPDPLHRLHLQLMVALAPCSRRHPAWCNCSEFLPVPLRCGATGAAAAPAFPAVAITSRGRCSPRCHPCLRAHSASARYASSASRMTWLSVVWSASARRLIRSL
jgi:hypothetical protein